jgi:hypothetical protein
VDVSPQVAKTKGNVLVCAHGFLVERMLTNAGEAVVLICCQFNFIRKGFERCYESRMRRFSPSTSAPKGFP